jgi:hypothetical protein
VINMSLGFSQSDPALRDAVADAAACGVLVVAAAGNNRGSDAFYPAWYPDVMSIAATREDDMPASCSNHSVHTSVSAPGDGIVSLDKTGSTMKGPCGTSAATPHVSALAAMLVAQDGNRTAQTVRSIIESTADDAMSDLFPGRDDRYGSGRINFDRALAASTSGLPQVMRLTSGFARVQDGAMRAPFQATTSNADAAEWFIDSLGEPGTGAAAAVSGSTLSGLATFAGTPVSGVHRLYVRAHDPATGWGPATVAALVVDRKTPAVAIVPPPLGTYVGIGGAQSVPVKTTIVDDRSPTATVVMTVSQTLGDMTITAYTSPAQTVALWSAAQFEFDWMPQPTDAGEWTITVTVTDRAGNSAKATAPVVVV